MMLKVPSTKLRLVRSSFGWAEPYRRGVETLWTKRNSEEPPEREGRQLAPAAQFPRNSGQIRKMPQQHISQARRHEDPRVAYLLDRLEKKPERSLDLKALARSVRLSVRQVQRIFKAATGNTITAFLKEVRLKHAADLLLSDYELVSQIAYSLGYTTHEHFTRDFTAFFGMSPTAYRRRLFGGKSDSRTLTAGSRVEKKREAAGKGSRFPKDGLLEVGFLATSKTLGR